METVKESINRDGIFKWRSIKKLLHLNFDTIVFLAQRLNSRTHTQINTIMKKLFIISAILSIVALTSNQSSAQVSINVNIGAQPSWVPVGYQSVDYYYLPEVQSYYYVPQRQFVFLSGNRWTRSRYLPARYRGYDLHHGRKIVMYGNSPYRSYRTHRVRYANNYGNHRVIRSSYRSDRGPAMLYGYKGHGRSDRHYSYGGGRGRDKGHDRGHGHGKGRH